jgi:hypothetical protein
VQGVTLTRSIPVTAAAPKPLARTGWDNARIVLFGLMLLSFGFGLVSLSYRRRHGLVGNVAISERLSWMK